MARANVLVAEDDAVLLNLYLKKFSVAGFSVRVVENGQLAADAIAQEVPDILVTDIHMPVMDGFQLLEKFPKASRSFAVIALTNFGEDKYKARGYELGVDNYFVKKDMTIRSLIEMVEEMLRKRGKLKD
jgi:DNA-binding response OmpR family regulator